MNIASTTLNQIGAQYNFHPTNKEVLVVEKNDKYSYKLTENEKIKKQLQKTQKYDTFHKHSQEKQLKELQQKNNALHSNNSKQQKESKSFINQKTQITSKNILIISSAFLIQTNSQQKSLKEQQNQQYKKDGLNVYRNAMQQL